jgi:uncharacterized protein YndB with AHSA1/START domain
MAIQAQEIILSQTISSSPAQIYEAFTTADGWCKWCCETAELEGFVGGKLHIFTEGYNAYGEFTELEQNRVIAFTWLGDREPPTLIHVSLKESEGQTGVTFKVSIIDPEQKWPTFAEFLDRIWGRALENLKDVLEAELK